jgi:hypothetical protein
VTQPSLASRHPHEVATEPVPLPAAGTGERSERRRANRRHAREQFLTVLVLLAMLALTVALLLSKWMGGASGSQPGGFTQTGAPARAVARRTAPAGRG